MSSVIICQVCTEKINKSTRSIVKCKCNYICCKSCAKTYLLSSSKNAHCMNCKIEWHREFMVINFDKNFINKTYKIHRENVLFEREIALLPSTQPQVELIKKTREYENRIQFLRTETRQIYAQLMDETNNKVLSDQMFEYEKEINYLENELYDLKINGVDKKIVREFIRQCPNNNCRGFLSKNLYCELCHIHACSSCREIKNENHICNPDTLETIKLMQKDTKPCPKCATMIFKIEGCFAKDTPVLLWNGTTKMSQNICIGDTLIGDDGNPRKVLNLMNGQDDMYEIIQNNGMKYIVNSEHTMVFKYTGDKHILNGISIDSCNIVEIKVKNYLEIKNDYILNNLLGYKRINSSNDILTTHIKINYIGKDNYYGWSVDGNKRFLLQDFTVVRNCDQMYCLQCHTAFSWKTLQIETGTIHNPHYFEWIRSQNNGQIPRNPLDIPCGQEVDVHFTIGLYRTLDMYNSKLSLKIYEICEKIIHIREVDKRKYYVNPQDINLDLRIEYMLNDIDQQKFKVNLQKREKKNNKKIEIHNIIDMFVMCLTDIMYRLNEDIQKIDKILSNIIKIIKQEYSIKITKLNILSNTSLSKILKQNEIPTDIVSHIEKYISEINHLKTYTNQQFEKIADIYHCKKLQYNNDFRLV